jgi:hypothetical protein
MNVCPYSKCNLGCKNIYEHRVKYSNMKKYYNNKKIKIKKSLRSSKVNWEKYKEIFKDKDLQLL